MSTAVSPSPRRRRRRSRISMPLLLAVLAAVFLAGFAAGRLLPDDDSSGEGSVLEQLLSHKDPPETPDWVTVDLLPENQYSRPGTTLEVVRGIVVHYVGNPGTTAQNNRDYFAGLAETGETYASSHFVIGMDGEIIQCVPLDEIAYCSNSRNSDTLSIECCHAGEDGQFSQATYDSLVKLTAYLADYYGLGRDELLRHYDVTGKCCPRYFVDHEDAWEEFKDDVFR